MAITRVIQERIGAFVRELCEELGEIDDREALSLLDALETQAVEIGDRVHAEFVEQRWANRPAENESACPQCGQPGRYQGCRQRELLGRRGPITISEPEYFCPCCRKAFFPDGPPDRR